MKRENLIRVVIVLFIALIGSTNVFAGGGGGGCSMGETIGSPTTISAGTTYSMDNSGCDATAACEFAALSYCGGCNCTFDECYYQAMGAMCSIYSCFCGSAENTMYAKYCPTVTGSYTFAVSSISCSGGGASLQWGIQATGTACSSGWGMYCNGGATGSASTSQTLTAGVCYDIFFDGNAGAACTFNFAITAPVLPIELLTLVGEAASEGGMMIKWSTGSETNNDFFTIERSADGSSFKEIGRVKGAGNSNQTIEYAYFDGEAPVGFSYYRIKQTDFDGQFEYSQIIGVFNQVKGKFEVRKIYPTPTRDLINISYVSDDDRDVTVYFYDLKGNRMGNELKDSRAGSNLITMDVSGLPKGTYYAVVEKGTKKQMSKFVVY